MGMRGKKAGFVGMRGKKAVEGEWDEDIYIRKIADVLARLMAIRENDHSMFKRAGFVGMRGKKSNREEIKRAGFVGMRGKRSYYGDMLRSWYDDILNTQGEEDQQTGEEEHSVGESSVPRNVLDNIEGEGSLE